MRVALPVLGLLATAATAFAQQSLTDSVRVEINRVFAPLTATDAPGCAVGISRAGAVVFQNAYGMANLEFDAPNTPASIFHVASVSKQFTAAAIMLLAREGRLSLDDDVRKYLPEVPDYGHKITIRHLLTHTSGLRDQWDLLRMARGRFEEDRITEDDVLEIVSRQKALNFTPGAEYLYSNTGFTLAGTIVKRVSGKSLREFADEHLFKPLGMANTHFHDDYTMIVKGRAAGYARRPDGTWRVSLPNFDTYGATSLFSTVGDLLKWQANFDYPVVADMGLLRAMEGSATLTNGDTTGYGLGIITEMYRGTRLVGHSGSDAGYRAYLGRFPAHGLSVTVLCNASTANPLALTRGIADVILGSTLAPVEPPVVVSMTLTPQQLARFAGVYSNTTTGTPQFVTLRSDTLVWGRTTGPVLLPLSETRFRIRGQSVEVEFTATPGREMMGQSRAWPPQQPIAHRREPVVQPTAATLAAYRGTYYSEELGATYSVSATESTVVLKTRMGPQFTVRHAYGDTFTGDFQITFTRARSGAVDGMLMGSARVRKVRFNKVPR